MSYGTFSNSNHLVSGTFSSTFDWPITIVAWIKRTGAEWAGGIQAYVVQFADDTGVDTDNGAAIHTPATDNIRARAFRDSSGSAAADHAFTTDAYDDLWVPLIGKFTGDASRQVYIKDSADTGSENTGDGTLTNLMDSLCVGVDASLGANAFNGLIAEVAIFSKALTDAEIDKLWTSANTGPRPNTVASSDCIAYWSLDTDQTTHVDESGNSGPSLTEASAVAFDSDHPTITGGLPSFHGANRGIARGVARGVG